MASTRCGAGGAGSRGGVVARSPGTCAVPRSSVQARPTDQRARQTTKPTQRSMYRATRRFIWLGPRRGRGKRRWGAPSHPGTTAAETQSTRFGAGSCPRDGAALPGAASLLDGVDLDPRLEPGPATGCDQGRQAELDGRREAVAAEVGTLAAAFADAEPHILHQPREGRRSEVVVVVRDVEAV